MDIDIRLGNNDVHFASRPPSQGRGGVPPAIDERLAREFLFPKSGSYPQLDDRHDVTVLTSTRLGVLVGIYKGEWGGGLIYLPRRGEAQLLVREPVRNIFELGGRVYVIGGDYLHRSELYELTRRGRSQAWELRLRFRLPGWLLETRKTDDEVVLVTDGGTVTLHATGIIEVSP